MLTEKEYKEIREELDNCKRPLFFFDDDPDGLCSFLLLYRYAREGKGVVVKSSPELKPIFLKTVENYGPDKVFIIDKPMVSPEFIDAVKVPIIWIDHHNIIKNSGTKYFNSRKDGFGEPASCICYRVVKQDLWIAACGAVGDWYLPDFSAEFSRKYPDLLPAEIKRPEKALYETKLGELIRILSFILKGKTSDVLSCIKILTRIKTPYELLNEETAQAKFIIKRFKKVKEEYDSLLDEALEHSKADKIIIFTYSDEKMSFTGDLSNELLYRFPKKIILVAREKGGEMKSSLRSSGPVSVSEILKKALVKIEGYGGGHEHACGACIKKKDFEKFVENIKKEL
ncbi:MAG: DHH family phosphoesterase [Nanoarchaeota archaeon]|nr:DHH family phosphoesterase [Nanoarchaeota archaeon]MBU4492892.1 DHH family phosphoesterase [Nanoarchaeota archaeon]